MTKYHANDKGVVGACRADVNPCRFAPKDDPNGNHYATKDEAQHAAAKKLATENDILPTLKKAAVKPLKMKVYRSGPVAPPAERGIEKECYSDIDEFRPEGRQGRMTGIFASPSMKGVSRWAYANAMNTRNPDALVREISVDANSVYVYKVGDWESASGEWNYRNYNERSYAKYKEESEKYWSNGITLKEWTETIDPSEAAEWELLLGSEDALSIRPVSDKKVAAEITNESRGSQMLSAFKRMRWKLKDEKERAEFEKSRLDK